MRLTDEQLERRVTRYEAVKRALIIFTAILVTICLGLLLWLAAQNRSLLNTVNDCTQPTGKCNQRGQHQTAEAVANINRVVILAAACATGLPQGLTVVERQTEIQACVINRLAADHRKR